MIDLDGIHLHHGDCITVMKTLPANSIDAIVTDPPYGLEFMGKEWDAPWKQSGTVLHDPSDVGGFQDGNGGNAYSRSRIRYGMGEPVAFGEWCRLWATEALRVLKPGGHACVFGGDRTIHRMVCGLEDAGFEIRGMLCFLHGQGFPKNLNVTNALRERLAHDLCACAPHSTRTPQDSPAGYPSNPRSDGGLPLPGVEDGLASPLPLADAPARTRSDQPRDGLDGARASSDPGADNGHPSTADSPDLAALLGVASHAGGTAPSDTHTSTSRAAQTAAHTSEPSTPGTSYSGFGSEDSSPLTHPYITRCLGCDGLVIADGIGSALKPAWEGISLARKPLTGTVAQTVLEHGTGALNIDASRIGPRDRTEYGLANATRSRGATYGEPSPSADFDATAGRWPANVLLDADAAAQLDAQTGERPGAVSNGSRQTTGMQGTRTFAIHEREQTPGRADSGGASRFFYTSKASSQERANPDGTRTQHPTVKPLDLMRWLVRLVTPPGGIVCDPFAGSGTTLQAARMEGFRSIGIEQDAQHIQDIQSRLSQLTLDLGGPA